MLTFLKKVYHVFFLSDAEKMLFCFFNKKKQNNIDSKKIILLQCVEDYFYYSLFGSIIHAIREREHIRVDQYVVRNLTLGSRASFRNFLVSIFFSNRFRDNKWVKLYSSFCDNLAYRHEGSTSLLFDIKALVRAYEVFKNIETKEQLLSLKISNIKVGDLIYDSYLRFRPAPTVDLNDLYLMVVIWQAYKSVEVTKQYFNEYKPCILLVSYSTYIQHGIAVRVALDYNTSVYSFGNYQSLAKHLNKNNWHHIPNVEYYKDAFECFTGKEKKLSEAQLELEKRLGGGIDAATSYMKESAYKIIENDVPNVEGAIVVFLHDFYDSPHVYGDMVFPDFLEWLEFTIRVLERENIHYVLKPHPNQLPESQKVIDKLKIKYPSLRLISSKITNRQLVDGGIKLGISVYGTVGHELPYMGVPVVLCGKNPHSSFNFCYEAKSRDEYIKLITSFNSLKIKLDVKQQIEAFYYMHNLNHSNSMKDLLGNISKLRNTQFTFSDKSEWSEFVDIIHKIWVNKEFNLFLGLLLQGIGKANKYD